MDARSITSASLWPQWQNIYLGNTMTKHLLGERNHLPQWQNIYIGNTIPDEHGYLNTPLKGIEVQGLFAVGIFQGT